MYRAAPPGARRPHRSPPPPSRRPGAVPACPHTPPPLGHTHTRPHAGRLPDGFVGLWILISRGSLLGCALPACACPFSPACLVPATIRTTALRTACALQRTAAYLPATCRLHCTLRTHHAPRTAAAPATAHLSRAPPRPHAACRFLPAAAAAAPASHACLLCYCHLPPPARPLPACLLHAPPVIANYAAIHLTTTPPPHILFIPISLGPETHTTTTSPPHTTFLRATRARILRHLLPRSMPPTCCRSPILATHATFSRLLPRATSRTRRTRTPLVPLCLLPALLLWVRRAVGLQAGIFQRSTSCQHSFSPVWWRDICRTKIGGDNNAGRCGGRLGVNAAPGMYPTRLRRRTLFMTSALQQYDVVAGACALEPSSFVLAC